MTDQQYHLSKLQVARLKEKLHRRFVYADAIAFTKTLLLVEKYEQNQREKNASRLGR